MKVCVLFCSDEFVYEAQKDYTDQNGIFLYFVDNKIKYKTKNHPQCSKKKTTIVIKTYQKETSGRTTKTPVE